MDLIICQIAFWVSFSLNVVFIIWVALKNAELEAVRNVYNLIIKDLKDGKLKFEDKK